MKKILLDTNFIIRCLKQKIDLFEDLRYQGYKILIPNKVFIELERIKNSKQKLHNRKTAELALKLLNLVDYGKIELKGKNTDKSIIGYAKAHPEVIIATLDREIKKAIPNNKAVIKNLKKIEII